MGISGPELAPDVETILAGCAALDGDSAGRARGPSLGDGRMARAIACHTGTRSVAGRDRRLNGAAGARPTGRDVELSDE